MIAGAALVVIWAGRRGWYSWRASPRSHRSARGQPWRRWAARPAINRVEHAPRALVGAAMVIRAPEAAWPTTFAAAGWFIVASSAVILAMPLRWHNGYARWWAARIPAMVIRILAIPALALAGALAYGAI